MRSTSHFHTLVETPPHRAPTLRAFLVLPAMGVPASFYATLAERLALRTGAAVAVAELRGQGSHPQRASSGGDWSYAEIVEHDIPALLRALRARYPHRRLHVVGHSLGGQLAALALVHVARQIDGLVLVAAGTAHWRAWTANGALDAAKAWLTVHAIRLIALLLPYYPGRRLGFGGDQPRALMRDWSGNATSGRYALHRSATDYEAALRALPSPPPLLAINLNGDAVAPPSATDALLGKLPASAPIERAKLGGTRGHSPWKRHFSWARQPDAVVEVIDRWSRGLLLRHHRQGLTAP